MPTGNQSSAHNDTVDDSQTSDNSSNVHGTISSIEEGSSLLRELPIPPLPERMHAWLQQIQPSNQNLWSKNEEHLGSSYGIEAKSSPLSRETPFDNFLHHNGMNISATVEKNPDPQQ